jgi:hypothetical protein
MLAKKIILIFTIFFLSFSYADTTGQTDETEKKITFLYINSDNCKYCDVLDELLKEDKIAELISKKFIIKRVMLDKDLELPEGLPVPFGTPTIYFLDHEDKALIQPMRGEKSEEDILLFLNEAISEFEKLFPKKKSSFWGIFSDDE